MLRRSVLVLFLCGAAAGWASELRFCLRIDPKTFNPLLVEDESSQAIRYLTGGVLDPPESLHAGVGRRTGGQMEGL